MSRWRVQRGAATPDFVGVGVVVAVLLAGLGAWLPRTVDLGQRPPPIIASVAAPVDRIEEPPYVVLQQRLWPHAPYASGSGIVDRSLARAWAATLDWHEFQTDAQLAFNDGFERCLIRELRAIRDDPLRQIADLVVPSPSELGRLPGAGRAGKATAAGRLPAPGRPAVAPAARELLESYRKKLRGKPPRDASLTISREAGCLAFDLALSKGKGIAKKAAGRRLGRDVGSAPAPRRG